jgi:hypothetical protein
MGEYIVLGLVIVWALSTRYTIIRVDEGHKKLREAQEEEL